MTRRNSTSRILTTPLNRRRLIGSAALAGASAAALGSFHAPAILAQDSVEVTWSSWGNTGEVAMLTKFTETYNEMGTGVTAKYIPVPTDGYQDKLLTQLNGGTAPDVFYSGDALIATLIKNQSVTDLTEMLSSAESKSKPEDFAGDLWGPAQTADGRIFGVPVDCNPIVLWYNKKLLEEAGVTEMPADSYEAGNWNWDTFMTVVDQVLATGKRAFVSGGAYSWVTNNGGKIYADGQYVANTDAKAVEAYNWIQENIKAEKFTFAGGLPEGQGEDAMFMSGQLAFTALGRWGLPLFRENKNLECDIVPYPTNTGNKIEPSSVAVAYWVMNAATDTPAEAFQFYTHFVSPDGQKGRLSEGGNAVPSIKGVEEVVTSDSLPEHKQYFLDARNVGYGPFREEAGTPGLITELDKIYEELFLNGGDVQTALDAAAEKANTMIAEAGTA
jgi:multiple sugar transport system substrate-binding protein